MTPLQTRFSRGFTIMELATVIAVIFILIVLTVPAYNQVRAHVERVNCSNNLHQLYIGASAYVQEYRHWPQVNPALLQAPHHAYDEAWIESLIPFGVPRATWICPTIQRGMGNPDYTQPDHYRTDYIAMPYDIKPTTPNTWPTQPWFAERGNVHGTGNLLILANGSVTDLFTLDPIAASAANSGL